MRFLASKFGVVRVQAHRLSLQANPNTLHNLPTRTLRPPPCIQHLSRRFSTFESLPVTVEASGSGQHQSEQEGEASFEPVDSFHKRDLPQTCPGCGALSQETSPGNAGYYSRSRKAVKTYLKQLRERDLELALRSVQAETMADADLVAHQSHLQASFEVKDEPGIQIATPERPVCDRCHDLVFHASGQSIAHPSLENIADSIAESPFRRNHVYHVLDAADFPMSLIRNLSSRLALARPRSRNRRSQHDFSSKPTLSFIITRSDLLAPTKAVADSMMFYFQAELRRAMGRSGRNWRLGNIHLVSAKRGWWTKEIKESIWKRGGGNWMVGKVNVGKSNLFEVLFPKGSKERASAANAHQKENRERHHVSTVEAHKDWEADQDSLLPPSQPETSFPTLPLVSSLPGTTASPIRIPFGGRKGELIDLPGLDRGGLEQYIADEFQSDLVMTSRPNVSQLVIKPGQSLILGGGLIRITPDLDPNDQSTTMLAYPFVPIQAHVTSTEKATATQLQDRESGIKSILADGVGKEMRSAGVLSLRTDVTVVRSGPVIRAGVSLSSLPFRIYSTDIVIEGLGWIELVCQVRKRRVEPQLVSSDAADAPTVFSEGSDSPVNTSLQAEADFAPFSKQTGFRDDNMESTFALPNVEVFSPQGGYVAQRQPLGAWLKWNARSHQPKKT